MSAPDWQIAPGSAFVMNAATFERDRIADVTWIICSVRGQQVYIAPTHITCLPCGVSRYHLDLALERGAARPCSILPREEPTT